MESALDDDTIQDLINAWIEGTQGLGCFVSGRYHCPKATRPIALNDVRTFLEQKHPEFLEALGENLEDEELYEKIRMRVKHRSIRQNAPPNLYLGFPSSSEIWNQKIVTTWGDAAARSLNTLFPEDEVSGHVYPNEKHLRRDYKTTELFFNSDGVSESSKSTFMLFVGQKHVLRIEIAVKEFFNLLKPHEALLQENTHTIENPIVPALRSLDSEKYADGIPFLATKDLYLHMKMVQSAMDTSQNEARRYRVYGTKWLNSKNMEHMLLVTYILPAFRECWMQKPSEFAFPFFEGLVEDPQELVTYAISSKEAFVEVVMTWAHTRILLQAMTLALHIKIVGHFSGTSPTAESCFRTLAGPNMKLNASVLWYLCLRMCWGSQFCRDKSRVSHVMEQIKWCRDDIANDLFDTICKSREWKLSIVRDPIMSPIQGLSPSTVFQNWMRFASSKDGIDAFMQDCIPVLLHKFPMEDKHSRLAKHHDALQWIVRKLASSVVWHGILGSVTFDLFEQLWEKFRVFWGNDSEIPRMKELLLDLVVKCGKNHDKTWYPVTIRDFFQAVLAFEHMFTAPLRVPKKKSSSLLLTGHMHMGFISAMLSSLLHNATKLILNTYHEQLSDLAHNIMHQFDEATELESESEVEILRTILQSKAKIDPNVALAKHEVALSCVSEIEFRYLRACMQECIQPFVFGTRVYDSLKSTRSNPPPFLADSREYTQICELPQKQIHNMRIVLCMHYKIKQFAFVIFAQDLLEYFATAVDSDPSTGLLRVIHPSQLPKNLIHHIRGYNSLLFK